MVENLGGMALSTHLGCAYVFGYSDQFPHQYLLTTASLRNLVTFSVILGLTTLRLPSTPRELLNHSFSTQSILYRTHSRKNRKKIVFGCRFVENGQQLSFAKTTESELTSQSNFRSNENDNSTVRIRQLLLCKNVRNA